MFVSVTSFDKTPSITKNFTKFYENIAITIEDNDNLYKFNLKSIKTLHYF